MLPIVCCVKRNLQKRTSNNGQLPTLEATHCTQEFVNFKVKKSKKTRKIS
jgi:hypothetical protein